MLHSQPKTLHENPHNGNTVSYNGIDLVKFICAIFVCAIHVDPFGTQAAGILKYLNFGIQHYVARLAVPFFFVCSGFFLFRKINHSEDPGEVMKNYCFKLIRLLGLWTILLAKNPTLQLWYISATVVAIVIAGLLLKLRLRYSQLLIIAGGLYIFGLLGDSYHGLAEKLTQIKPVDYLVTTYTYFFSTTRNGFFMGFPFVLIGMLFAHGKIKLKTSVSLIGFFVSALFLLCEVFLLKYFDIPKDYNMYVFLIPATMFLFAFASQIKLKDSPVYSRLRAAGVLIYFSHTLVYKFVYFGMTVIRKLIHVDLSPYAFWMTLVTVTGLAFLIEHLSRKKNLKWLSRLYS